MSKLNLEEEEYILSSDEASAANEFFPRKGMLYLTNARLLFLDASSWRKPHNISIFLDTIDLLDTFKNGFSVDTEEGIFYFTGKGSIRIFEKLNARRQALSIGAVHDVGKAQDLREIIYLQGDINLVQNTFNTPAQLFFTSKELRITTNPSFFRRTISKSTTLEDISSFEYKLRNKTLYIHIRDTQDPIIFSGDLAPRLYLTIHGHKDGGIADSWNNIEANYTKGLLKIKGRLSITKKRVAFCPTESIDSIAQAKELDIPIEKITRIERKGWPEKNIVIFFEDKEIAFTTKDTERDFPFFRKAITDQNPIPPWKVRTKAELQKVNAEWDAPLKPNSEKILLINWAAHKINNDCFHIGWLMLTNLQMRFLCQNKEQKWSAPILQIQKSLEQYSGIRVHYKNNEFEFYCFGGSKFTKRFWNKVKTLKPPPELSEARSGQEINKIVGSAPLALIFREGVLIHRLSGIFVRKTTQKISLECNGISYTELKKGNEIEIELPKIIGRFRFYCSILNQYLTKPTPSGSYEIEVSIPDNIYVYNQRKAFRVPLIQGCTLHLHRSTAPSKHLLYEEIPIERNLEGTFFDISFGGCGIYLHEDLNDSDKKTILLRFSCILFGKSISLQGVVRHIAFKENQQIWAHGVEFIHLPDKIEQQIFESVLQLERDMLKEENEEEI